MQRTSPPAALEWLCTNEPLLQEAAAAVKGIFTPVVLIIIIINIIIIIISHKNMRPLCLLLPDAARRPCYAQTATSFEPLGQTKIFDETLDKLQTHNKFGVPRVEARDCS